MSISQISFEACSSSSSSSRLQQQHDQRMQNTSEYRNVEKWAAGHFKKMNQEEFVVSSEWVSDHEPGYRLVLTFSDGIKDQLYPGATRDVLRGEEKYCAMTKEEVDVMRFIKKFPLDVNNEFAAKFSHNEEKMSGTSFLPSPNTDLSVWKPFHVGKVHNF